MRSPPTRFYEISGLLSPRALIWWPAGGSASSDVVSSSPGSSHETNPRFGCDRVTTGRSEFVVESASPNLLAAGLAPLRIYIGHCPRVIWYVRLRARRGSLAYNENLEERNSGLRPPRGYSPMAASGPRWADGWHLRCARDLLGGSPLVDSNWSSHDSSSELQACRDSAVMGGRGSLLRHCRY
jgi:hypothetical protein